MNPPLHRLEVGKPYHPDRKVWPECLVFDARRGDLELIWFVDRPHSGEIAAVKRGGAELALHVDDAAGLVVVCSRFGPAPDRADGLPWSDAPYSWHLTREAERTSFRGPAELGPDERALLQILLVDATTGILLAIRVVSLSPEFTRALFGAIRRQSSRRFGRAQYDAALAALYYGRTSARIAAEAVVSCRGGD